MALLTAAIVFVAGATYPAAKNVADNMNGEYRLSKTAGAPAGGYFPTNFKNGDARPKCSARKIAV